MQAVESDEINRKQRTIVKPETIESSSDWKEKKLMIEDVL